MFSPILGGYLSEFPFGFYRNLCRAWLRYDPKVRELVIVTGDQLPEAIPCLGLDGVE